MENENVLENDRVSVIKRADYWEVNIKGLGKSYGIGFHAIPFDASDDFALGYGTAVAFHESAYTDDK